MVIVILLLSLVPVECIYTDVVVIEQGSLQGFRSVSGQNRFYGIPYAESRRFQPPSDPLPWDGVFIADRRFTSCAQTVASLSFGTEDCLQLDVFTPEAALSSTDRLPVMIFIHGGAYYYGSKAHYDPEFLVTKNVVSVIINYRMGVLGFLCVKDVTNLGLKDQVAALKWIKRNIAAFGGDPDNVTLFGQSAGASAAAMQMLSPLSRGLFHKAILFSGTPFAPWAFNPDPLKPALEDASKFGNATKDDILDIFQQAPLHELLQATKDTSINTMYFKYSPCIDNDAKEPFFAGTPYDVITSGNFNKVPIISGFTGVEGVLFYGLHSESTLKDYDKNFDDKLPSVFSHCSKRHKALISSILREEYFGFDPINSSAVNNIVKYYSDWIAYSSVEAFSQLISKYSDAPIYNYMFNYEGGRNFAKAIFGSTSGLTGASHSDDIFYVFKPAGISLLLSNKDRMFIERFTTMLVNFMKTGNPTPRRTKLLPTTWQSRSANVSSMLELGSQMTMTTTPKTHSGGAFLALLCEYGLNGYVPCHSQDMCLENKG